MRNNTAKTIHQKEIMTFNNAIQNWPEVYKIVQRSNYKDIKKGFSFKKKWLWMAVNSAWGKVFFFKDLRAVLVEFGFTSAKQPRAAFSKIIVSLSKSEEREEKKKQHRWSLQSHNAFGNCTQEHSWPPFHHAKKLFFVRFIFFVIIRIRTDLALGPSISV